MEDWMYTLDMEWDGPVPDQFHAPAVAFGEPCGDHGYYGATTTSFYGEFYPQQQHTATPFCDQTPQFGADGVTTCFQQQQLDMDPASKDPYMCETALLSKAEEWVQETYDLAQMLRHEALSPSPEPPAAPLIQDAPMKSQMEIFHEITEEATQFVGSSSQSPGTSPQHFAELTSMSVEPPEAPVVDFQAALAEKPRELDPLEVNAILESQIPYLQEDPPGFVPDNNTEAAQAVVAAQGVVIPAGVDQEIVVQTTDGQQMRLVVVGTEVAHQDGTRVVIVKPPEVAGGDASSVEEVETASDGGACTPEVPRKKRVYQKGGYERKKQQNRESAQRYRMKKKLEKDIKMSEYNEVSARNKDLKSQVAALEQEMTYWKNLMEGVGAVSVA